MQTPRKLAMILGHWPLIVAGLTVSSACGDDGPPGRDVDRLEIRIENFFPEGVALDDKGSMFVGSFADGTIVKFPPGVNTAEVLVQGASFGDTAAAGMIVDNENATLWLCTADLDLTIRAAVRAISTETGQIMMTADLPAGSFCNDVALDDSGNLYATDSFRPNIFRLTPGGDAVAVWREDEAFDPVPGPLGMRMSLNGIAWDGVGALYVGKSGKATMGQQVGEPGQLFRIPIEADGTAGTPRAIALTPALSEGGIDGLKSLDENTLVAIDGGVLKTITVSGDTATTQVVKEGLDFATTFALDQDEAWVVESQIDHLLNFDTTPAQLPFVISRHAIR